MHPRLPQKFNNPAVIAVKYRIFFHFGLSLSLITSRLGSLLLLVVVCCVAAAGHGVAGGPIGRLDPHF